MAVGLAATNLESSRKARSLKQRPWPWRPLVRATRRTVVALHSRCTQSAASFVARSSAAVGSGCSDGGIEDRNP